MWPFLRSCATAAVTALFALPAGADIAWQTDHIGAGSVLVLESDDGAVFTHMKCGMQRGLAVFDTFAGESVAGTYVGSYLTTPRGEITQAISATGAVTEYHPHRCMRTLGDCRYTVVHPDGTREARRRVTVETSEGLAFEEFAGGVLVQRGALALDALGSAREGWNEVARTGRKTKTRRVMVAYR